MAEQLGKEIKKGFAWNFAEQVSFKMMQFIIQMIMQMKFWDARLQSIQKQL